MSRVKKAIVFGVAILSGACALVCLIAALSLIHYQPAVVAASGVEMRWPTRPGLWASVVKSYQSFVEIRTCDYTVLGWSGEGVLFYQEACQGDLPQVWAYDPENGGRPRHVEAVPLGLVQEAIPRSSILAWVRSPLVRPADAEPTVRNLAVRADGLASPDGRWVAVVVRHIYGPEDVIVLASPERTSTPKTAVRLPAPYPLATAPVIKMASPPGGGPLSTRLA